MRIILKRALMLGCIVLALVALQRYIAGDFDTGRLFFLLALISFVISRLVPKNKRYIRFKQPYGILQADQRYEIKETVVLDGIAIHTIKLGKHWFEFRENELSLIHFTIETA